MKSLIKTSIKRPVTICVLVVILLAVGVLATMDMSTNLLPNIKMPMMGITVVYPGAGAQSVEDNVTSPMENALQTIPGITELETRSYDNVSIAILTFDYGTDIDKKIDAIEDSFKTVSFPQGCYDPSFVKIDMNGTAAATLSVYNDENNLDVLSKDAESLATKLRAIEGVGSVSVLGRPEKQIKITALQGLDITALAIVQTLTAENLDLPLGTILQDGSVVSVRNASDAASLLDIMQLPVSMELGASAVSSLISLQTAVRTYATCTLEEFNDYVSKALDAKRVIDELEGKTSAELEELQDNLSAIKSLMSLVRENSSSSLRAMWHTIDINIVQNEEFVNMSDEDLQKLAEQLNVSKGVLKWLQDGCQNDGADLKAEWFKLVAFRELFPKKDTDNNGEINGDDITYDQFAYLFQDGAYVDADGECTLTATDTHFDGLDLLHSDVKHASCQTDGEGACDKETFTHGEAVDACEFADSVNTVAFRDIIDTVKDAEEKINNGETVEEPVISDAQFAALFVNSTQGNEFAALMSPQVIGIIRLENFNAEVNGKESIVKVLSEVKNAHVDKDGNAVYKNGVSVLRNEDNEIIVKLDGKEYRVNSFGRLTDSDGKLVFDKLDEGYYYSYGSYRVFDDDELIKLYERLGLQESDVGITPTADTVRFVRITEAEENASKIIVPLAYAGRAEQTVSHQAYAQYNGMLAVTLEVYAVSDANTTKVVNAVKQAMKKAETKGKVVLLDDKAEFINDSISNVLSSIIIGGVLAVLVIYLFVGKIGSSLVVAITMPLSVLVALLGLWAMNISLNLVSLGGLAVGIGMLVDNSIVVLESITKRRDMGDSVFDSCLNGTREVAGSLLASTLTNICVFFPILFAKGLTREIFYDLVWAVMFSIVMSLLVAVTVIPCLYHLIYARSPRPRYKKDKDGNKVLIGSYEDGEPRRESNALYDEKNVADNTVLSENVETAEVFDECGENVVEGGKKKNKKEKSRKVNAAERKRSLLYRMENGYGKVLSKVLKSRVLVCVIALVLFAGSVGLVFTTGMDFLPSVDKGVVEVNLRFDGSATLDEVNGETIKTLNAIRGKYGDKILYSSYTVGKQGMLPMNITGVARIQLDTKLLDTTETVNEIREILKTSDIKAKNVSVSEIDGVVAELTGEMAGQSVTLLSNDMEQLSKAADAIAKKLESVSGVVSVTDNTPEKTKQISFVFDKEECAKRGVEYQNAVLLLRVGMSGHDAASIEANDETMNVNVIFDDKTKGDVNELLNVIVGFDGDGAVKIRDVLKKDEQGNYFKEDIAVTVVNKRDGKYVTTVDVESYNVDMGTINKRVGNIVKETLSDFPDVQYVEGGVAYYLTDAMNGLVISLIAAFLLLYGVMACQFESLVKPFIVIMSIPFSFTGGFLALVITGTTLNVVSFVGLIMLMGVIVNGAIVMIDKIDQLIKDGVDPQSAVLEGCKSRLRPILMTTLTTVLALTPLAIGIGRGSELMQPMGIVVLGGLLLGTLVTLVLIPCFYCIVKRIKFSNNRAVAEEAPDLTEGETLKSRVEWETASVNAAETEENKTGFDAHEQNGDGADNEKNVGKKRRKDKK